MNQQNNQNTQLNKGDTVYYVRKIPKESNLPITYDILQLKFRTVDYENNMFVGIEKREEYCILFTKYDFDKIVFNEHGYALNKALELESIENAD